MARASQSVYQNAFRPADDQRSTVMYEVFVTLATDGPASLETLAPLREGLKPTDLQLQIVLGELAHRLMEMGLIEIQKSPGLPVFRLTEKGRRYYEENRHPDVNSF